MKQKKHIDQLLDKYWEGQSSLEEEKSLQQYFSGDEIANQHLAYQSLFQFFEKEKEQTYTKDIELDLPPQKEAVIRSISKFKWRAIAAAIAFLLFASYGVWQISQPTEAERIAQVWEENETTDPEQALEEFKSALLLASAKLNQGAKTAAIQVSKVRKAGKYIK
jgi:hypothetical protein